MHSLDIVDVIAFQFKLKYVATQNASHKLKSLNERFKSSKCFAAKHSTTAKTEKSTECFTAAHSTAAEIEGATFEW